MDFYSTLMNDPLTFVLSILYEVILILFIKFLDEVWDVIIVLLRFLCVGLALHLLVLLGQFSERGERVGTQLVEDTWDQFSEFLVVSTSVDGEGVGRDGCVDYFMSDKKALQQMTSA